MSVSVGSFFLDWVGLQCRKMLLQTMACLAVLLALMASSPQPATSLGLGVVFKAAQGRLGEMDRGVLDVPAVPADGVDGRAKIPRQKALENATQDWPSHRHSLFRSSPWRIRPANAFQIKLLGDTRRFCIFLHLSTAFPPLISHFRLVDALLRHPQCGSPEKIA